MRRAGRVVAEIHERCRGVARPGVTTAKLNDVAAEVIERRGARSSFLGYHGFPAVICASPNDVIVHGIPGERVLREGDIVGIDAGAVIDGYHGDAAVTLPIGQVSPEVEKLLRVTEEALHAGISQGLVGNNLGEVSFAVQTVAEGVGLSVVREYVGHGIGQSMHEDPQVPNWGEPGRGPKLKVGMCLAVEPMLNLGGAETQVREDGWTVVTADGSFSAHFEHTVLTTDRGPEILTLPRSS